MNYVALDPRAGKPLPHDLVWSALPDAPVQEYRPRWRKALRHREQRENRRSLLARVRTRTA